MLEIDKHLFEKPGQGFLADAVNAGARLGAVGDAGADEKQPALRRFLEQWQQTLRQIERGRGIDRDRLVQCCGRGFRQIGGGVAHARAMDEKSQSSRSLRGMRDNAGQSFPIVGNRQIGRARDCRRRRPALRLDARQPLMVAS